MSDADYIIPDSHAQVLVDPKAYADGRIYDTYAWLRANNPIGLARPNGFDPFWVITRYNDLRAISRDNKRFPYGDRNSMLIDKASDDLVRSLTGGNPNFGRALTTIDPPEHMKYRLLTQSWFMPKNLKSLDERIEELSNKAVAKMAGRSTCDFVEDIALHYPLEVIMMLLGVPEKEFARMLKLTQQNFSPFDLDAPLMDVDMTDPAALAKIQQATMAELDEYFHQITLDRRENPRDDLATILSNAKIEGEYLPRGDLTGYYAIIALAGHDTTSSSLAAGMHALATQPDTFRRLKADPTLIPKLIEEAVRWASPVKTFMRSSIEATEFNGRQFQAGDWIMLCYGSANRDEGHIQNADQFDIDRPPFDHLAFGFGPHVCLGQHLARRELNTLFGKLISAIKTVELAGDSEISQSYFVNGFKHLPIRYELEDTAVPVAV